jgi:hypothetical protein
VRRAARRCPLQRPHGSTSLMIAGNPYGLQRILGCGSHVSRTCVASYSKPDTMQGENCRSVSARNVLAAIDGRDLEPFEYKLLGQLVEMVSEFAVNEVLGVKFSGLLAAPFWRATYLYKLESPQSRARVAADWFLDLFYRPAVTEIRDRG